MPESGSNLPWCPSSHARRAGAQKGRKVVKIGGKQIVLFHVRQGRLRLQQPLPPRGLSAEVEGTLDAEGCVLTCNWHNWKFDLEGGETLVGGDKLRRYPVEMQRRPGLARPQRAAGRPSAPRRSWPACASAFRRHEYERMARELSRLEQVGADPAGGAAPGDLVDSRTLRVRHHPRPRGSGRLAGSARDLERSRPSAWCRWSRSSATWPGTACASRAYPYAERKPALRRARSWRRRSRREDEPAAVALIRGALAEGLNLRQDLEAAARPGRAGALRRLRTRGDLRASRPAS